MLEKNFPAKFAKKAAAIFFSAMILILFGTAPASAAFSCTCWLHSPCTQSCGA